MSGNGKFFNGWSVGRARGTPGSSAVWRVPWRIVKLFGGPHSSKGISLKLGDGWFFIGKSKSPPIEVFGNSLMGAMGGRGFQVRFNL